jgi:predicted transcriptional regulator
MAVKTALSERERATVELLRGAGLAPGVAKVLVVMSKGEEVASVKIEGLTSMRQPEVSIAMRELMRRKWVRRRSIKKKGKGRPVQGYTLCVRFSSIVDELESIQTRKAREMERTVARLKRVARGL